MDKSRNSTGAWSAQLCLITPPLPPVPEPHRVMIGRTWSTTLLSHVSQVSHLVNSVVNSYTSDSFDSFDSDMSATQWHPHFRISTRLSLLHLSMMQGLGFQSTAALPPLDIPEPPAALSHDTAPVMSHRLDFVVLGFPEYQNRFALVIDKIRLTAISSFSPQKERSNGRLHRSTAGHDQASPSQTRPIVSY